MPERLPHAHFSDRPNLKALLGLLLPDMGPVSRLERFAQEAGHTSDEDFRSCGRAPLEADVFAESLSWSVGQGVVLPLLVQAGADLAELSTEAIIAAARDRLNPAVALQAPSSILETARKVPVGPARQFYAATMRELLFTVFGGGDRFWCARGGAAFEGLALMIDEVPAEAYLDENLIAHLVARPAAGLCRATQAGRQLVRSVHEAPSQTRAAILMTVREALSNRGVEQARSNWSLKSAAA